MNTFTVNGTEYKAKPFDFNLACDLEDMGISLEEMGNKRMSTVRAYFALCAGKGNEFAGKELEQHIISGGNIGDIADALNKEMETSDFFLFLKKRAEEEVTADETAESEENKNTEP